MDRRNFMKTTAVAGILPLGIESCSVNNSKMSCFIFSDAHIGWKGKAQPTLQTQAEMIQVIKQKFPVLDLVFDTGDVHHADIYDEERRLAREFWLQQMAGQFHESRFHYIPGNHELDRGRNDAEITAGQLGSFNFRPYYSFDYKGIHFVSVPQLLDTIYITKETLNWLKQDLVFNANKTTLIFSHNSLRGTTFNNGETGYRETVNSQEVMDVIDSHKQVLGWFHGHNHQYEIVKKHNRLYVSNGRIGGFNPPKKWGPFGQGHLGGIHINIDQNGLEVRAFSATKGVFMDQLGWPNLSEQILVDTSFDPRGKFNYYFGHGRLVNGVKYELNSHYLSTKKVEAIVVNNNTNLINENALFKNPSKFSFVGKESNRVIGFRVSPRKTTKFEATENGLEINLNKIVWVKLPNWGLSKKKYMARSGYYRCASGQSLKLSIDCAQLNGSEKIFYEYRLLNRSHDTVMKNNYSLIELNEGKGEEIIKIPNQFEGENTGDELYIVFTLKILGQNEALLFEKIELSQVLSIDEVAQNSDVELNNTMLNFDSAGHARVEALDMFNRGRAEFKLENSNSTKTILFQIPDVKWQIRNAVASLYKDKIIVHSVRSNFQKNQEIIFTPNIDIENYILKTQYLSEFELELNKKTLVVRVNGLLDSKSKVLLNAKSKISSILGGQVLNSEEQNLHWVGISEPVLVIKLA